MISSVSFHMDKKIYRSVESYSLVIDPDFTDMRSTLGRIEDVEEAYALLKVVIEFIKLKEGG